MECSFKPYEGDEPFIFVSYSHNDTPNVFPIMEELNKAGFRIWYDNGIEWGSIWTMELVNHINKCNVVMVFISRNSICSPHCQNEILYAASICKHFFPIYLEELILPPHLHAIFQSIQGAKFYEYVNKREQFIDWVRNASVLASAKAKASSEWLLKQGERYLREKNEEKAFICFKAVADRSNFLFRYIAQQRLKEMLRDSPAFKDLYDTQEKYFQNFSFKDIIMEPQAPYPKDKPKCDSKFYMTMEEFGKQISKKRS